MTNFTPLYWFPATPEERSDLTSAIAHNCDCHTDGSQVVRCASHTMALGQTAADRRALEGLLYVRRALLPRLAAGEFGTRMPPQATPPDQDALRGQV